MLELDPATDWLHFLLVNIPLFSVNLMHEQGRDWWRQLQPWAKEPCRDMNDDDGYDDYDDCDGDGDSIEYGNEENIPVVTGGTA